MNSSEMSDTIKRQNEEIGELRRQLEAGGIIPTDGAMAEELATVKADLGSAQKMIADMHAAAVGEVRGPQVGVVEDVAAVREELLGLKRMADSATAEILELKGQVDALNSKVGELEENVTDRETEIASLKASLTQAEESLKEFRDASSLPPA
jgi:chromosome segregation ATPase